MLVTLTGVGIVVPLLPIYAHSLGAGGVYIGLIFGVFSISRSFFLPVFGKFSDQLGRKPFIVTGLFFYAAISIAFILSSSVNSLIMVRFFQGIASAMIMPVILAYVGDITPPRKEGIMMGVFNISVFTGLSIGPLAGGFVNDRFGLDTAFAFMGILSFIGFLLCMFILPPRKSERGMAAGRKTADWKYLIKNRMIAGLFMYRFAYTSCIAIIWGFLPIYANMRFGLSASQIGILVTLGILVSGVIQIPMGYIADKWNKKTLILIGSLLCAGAVYGIQLSGSFRDLFIANFCFGLGGGIATPSHMALSVQAGTRTKSLGKVMSIITMGHSLGMMSGAVIAGVMMDVFELRHAFSFGSLFMTAGFAGFFICAGAPETNEQKN